MAVRQTLAAGYLLLGQYRIDRVLGTGGFGITYAAVDTSLDLAVAVKEYFPAEFGVRDDAGVRPSHPEKQSLFKHCLNSFLREARTLAQFRHPAIVRVLRVFEANGTAYMVMEFERGRSLAAVIEDRTTPLNQDEIDRIMLPLISALDVMHAASFIHRDLAPDNVIIRDDGNPVLIDFGAARQVLAEMSRNLTGIVKQGYSPPEQYAMDPKLQGPWTDIYALGGILYRLISGDAPTPAPERQLGIAMKPARAVGKGSYRAGFLDAIDRALQIAPSQRPATLAEFSALLFADATTEAARPRPYATPAVPKAEAAQRVAPEPVNNATWRNLHYAGLAALALGGLILVWQASGFLTQRTASIAIEADVRRIETETKAAAERKAAEDRRLAAERAEAERQRVAAEEKAAAERKAAEDRRRAAERAEVERQRIAAEQKAAAERKAAEDRRLEAIRAEAERLRIAAEEKAAAERRAAEERRLATERVEAERQRIAAEKQAAEQKAAEERRLAAERQKAADDARILVTDIRRELNRVGCSTDATTPGWSDADQRALQQFVEHSGGGVSFTELNGEIVKTLVRFRQRVCPLQCRTGEIANGDRCERAPTAAAPSPAVQCQQINERAQLGVLSEEDRALLRRLNCR